MRLKSVLLLSLVMCSSCGSKNAGAALDTDLAEVDTDNVTELCDFQNGPEHVAVVSTCPGYTIGGVVPLVEWEGGVGVNSSGLPVRMNSSGLPTVADFDGDGIPEIVVNLTSGLGTRTGDLYVYHGDTGQLMWKDTDALLGYGSHPAIADLDGDGQPEILVARTVGPQSALDVYTDTARYTIGAWNSTGVMMWQTDQFHKADFDYATSVAVSDMDHDGNPEIVAGRVIFNSDGSLRAKGTHGRGSWGPLETDFGPLSEASVSAVADLDLDGQEELIVGNAIYDIDGNDKWFNGAAGDGMIAVGNLDDDPQGEFVSSHLNFVTVRDANGDVLWGPTELAGATIVSSAAIGDLDHDGYPEIVVGAGSEIVAFRHDGTRLWSHPVSDTSGAAGASIFDLDADGWDEVIYADETNVYAFDGRTGVVRLQSDHHDSFTMMDYPVIADVDGDGSAEIIVTQTLSGYGFSVFGASGGRWAPARKLWNQHAYSRNDVNDDLTIPKSQVQAFTDPRHNSWHDATDPALYEVDTVDLSVGIVSACDTECSKGSFYVAVQPVNASAVSVAAGVGVTLYVVRGGAYTKVETKTIGTTLAAGSTGDHIVFEMSAVAVQGADAIRVSMDDTGGGLGEISECLEDNNSVELAGPFCEN